MTYPSDLTDEQWDLIKDHFSTGNYGKSRKYNQRELVNGVFYIIKTGCQWRFLPKDFPPYSTVHSFYWRAKKKRIWERMMSDLVERSRLRMGRNPIPSYSLIDSQSIKTTSAAKERGIDGGKKDKRS
jgi:transposase